MRSVCSHALLAVLTTHLCAQPASVRDVADLAEAERAALAAHVAGHSAAPTDYLAAKLAVHDVVLVGENHMVRENCAAVRDALAPLYRDAGLRWLCTEFLRARHTDAANAIALAEHYDEDKVVELFRGGPWPTWGFTDYMDIVRAVWQINHDRARDARPLRIVGMDSDWSQYQLWFGELGERRKFELMLERERTMTAAVEDGPLRRGGKALVHVGFAHSVTCQGERVGTVLRRKYGARIFQVALHQDLPAARAPAALAALLEASAEGHAPCGFDLVGSPFANLTDGSVAVLKMLPHHSLGEWAEGYLVLAPLAELHPVRWQSGFITDEHFAEAEAVAERLGWVAKGACHDAAELDLALAQRFPPPR